jgi:hypothetical protein
MPENQRITSKVIVDVNGEFSALIRLMKDINRQLSACINQKMVMN